MKTYFSLSVIARLVASVLLIWSLARHPYGYYTLLRWVVCGVAVYSAFISLSLEKMSWVWCLGIIALFFNPLVPIHLDKGTWAIIDVITAGIFIVSTFIIRSWDKPSKELSAATADKPSKELSEARNEIEALRKTVEEHQKQTFEIEQLRRDLASSEKEIKVVNENMPVKKNEDSDKTSKRILVVDDDPLGVDVIIEWLDSAGYICEGSLSANEALGKLQKRTFDLITTGIFMPGMDGREFIKTLRDREISTPVIVITGGGATIPICVEAMKNGANDFMAKPFEGQNLINTVGRILQIQSTS